LIKKLRESTEEWKTKARELQTQLDDIKAKFHDLEKEHKVSNSDSIIVLTR
jgi:hypothetical protein